MRILDRPSPHHEPRRTGPVDILLIHYTERDLAESLRLLTEGEVSVHWLIDEDGTVYRMVPEDRRAWHAGVSAWEGESDINSRSIGIELVNLGDHSYAEPQIDALIVLAREIMARHPIPPERVLGHEDVAPGRKVDPGPLFPWDRLVAEGIAVRPGSGRPSGVGV
ncbi:MAG: N-acetylmuramoyl-L-alanine amidase [Alphaproteobacteria bacterium]|nr:N-acetylmuramoyl-L-alanine amidase [Alphaproteobacteria bacterium]